jgi:SAM-dependent methyltransferase
MNPRKLSAIAHRDHDYCNPLAAAKYERLLDLLPLDESSRVLDLGCGRAELSLRIIERFGSTAIAVDNASLLLDAARERAEWTGALGKLHLDSCDVREYRADPETFHLAVVLDAALLGEKPQAIMRRMQGWTRSGGYVLAGLYYWKGRANGELAALMGLREADIADHAGNVQAGVEAGLIPMHAPTASVDEWDEYEWKYLRSIERYSREQPEDADQGELAERGRRLRDAYLRWGRDSLGFGAYLFYRPGPRVG